MMVLFVALDGYALPGWAGEVQMNDVPFPGDTVSLSRDEVLRVVRRSYFLDKADSGAIAQGVLLYVRREEP